MYTGSLTYRDIVSIKYLLYTCLFFVYYRGSALVGESGKLESLSSICLSVYFNIIDKVEKG